MAISFLKERGKISVEDGIIYSIEKPTRHQGKRWKSITSGLDEVAVAKLELTPKEVNALCAWLRGRGYERVGERLYRRKVSSSEQDK